MSKKIIIEDCFKKSLMPVTGQKKIGWFCTYAPEELILAAGLHPVRIMGKKKLKKSESYLPINFCPYLKSGWESLLSSKDGLSAVIFTNSCDGMRRLYDTAEHYLGDMPIFMLDVPRNTDDYSVEFFGSNLEDMLSFIEGIRGDRVADLDLCDAVRLMDRKRAALKDFSRLFFENQDTLDIADYYRIMEISISAKAEVFIDELNSLTDFLRNDHGAENRPAPKIMIIGNFITEEKLWKMLSGLDLDLVADDLCISSRYYERTPGANSKLEETKDRKAMLYLLAEGCLKKPGCMRMADMGKKLEGLKQKAGGSGVQGIIFISLKFCDTMLYSFPLIRKEFASLKIPVLYLEIEYNNFSEGQVKTRIQAFLEMI
ncbi:MAG: 2-hydroxyacyl-CoA dehydratase family protein [Actinomycetia bacterium]|nr:2-hydroxyacyl-CoA dehydratase family protein [Actinomycetes bacterium]